MQNALFLRDDVPKGIVVWDFRYEVLIDRPVYYLHCLKQSVNGLIAFLCTDSRGRGHRPGFTRLVWFIHEGICCNRPFGLVHGWVCIGDTLAKPKRSQINFDTTTRT